MTHAHILVVDDEQDLLELVRYNLTAAGYTVSCVSCGEDALAEAQTHQPDLMVLDVLLPGIDGLDVCKVLKNDASTASIPIIMLTARSEDADVVTGLELGADDYLVVSQKWTSRFHTGNSNSYRLTGLDHGVGHFVPKLFQSWADPPPGFGLQPRSNLAILSHYHDPL